MNYEEQLHSLIRNALFEDIGDGDHSTLSCVRPDAIGKAVLKIKEDGILAGVNVAEKIFRSMQPDIIFIRYKEDGDDIQIGQTAFEVEGNLQKLLQCERLVLN